MASLNSIQLIGHLGRDAESRTFPSGDTIATVSIATTDKWKDADGNKQERTEWFNLHFPPHLSGVVMQYLRKGDLIFVEGRLQSREFTDKDGAQRRHYEVRVNQMQMLRTGNEQGGQQRGDQDGRGGQQGGGRGQGGGGYQQRDSGGQRGGQGGGRGGYDDRGQGGRGNDQRGGQQQRGQGGGYQDNGTQQDRSRGQGDDRGGYAGENNRGGGQARPPAPARSSAPARAPEPSGGVDSSGFDSIDQDIPFLTAGFFADTMVADRKGKRLARASF